jgi:hypothetical protein
VLPPCRVGLVAELDAEEAGWRLEGREVEVVVRIAVPAGGGAMWRGVKM